MMIKPQSWYKRSFYVSFSSSFTMCTFQTITEFKLFEQRDETDIQSGASILPDQVILCRKRF
jgi:hypothetical protein